MSRPYTYITVNNPNIPVLPTNTTAVLGQFVDTPYDEKNACDPAVAMVKARDMYLPHFSLREFEGVFTKDALLVNQEALGTEFLGSCIFLKGNVKSRITSGTWEVESFNRSQNFKYDPNNEYRHLMTANDPFHYVHFSFTSEYCSQFLPENETWSTVLKARINKKERILGDHFAPLSLAQERALQNIFDCPLTGKLGELMIETSVVQIILLQLHALFGSCETPVYHTVAKRDIETIQELKEYLSKTYLDDHSLMSLAKHFGTNTNKLMTLFKKFFRKSIFEYISDMRMDHAQHLLREKDLRVVEVARTVGYKNPNHFSSAFKKRYGINPSDFR